jgi:CHASE3 domain sensor protein
MTAGLAIALVFTLFALAGVLYGWRRCAKSYDSSVREHEEVVRRKKDAEQQMMDEADRLGSTVEVALTRLQQRRPSA